MDCQPGMLATSDVVRCASESSAILEKGPTVPPAVPQYPSECHSEPRWLLVLVLEGYLVIRRVIATYLQRSLQHLQTPGS